MKKKMYSEAAYILGLIVLGFGTAFMERANFGMSMVVAPAYLVYLKLSQSLTWFTFGMAEYCFQALLLLVLTLVLGRFKRKFLFSFVTAFLYGTLLDGIMSLVSLIPGSGMVLRVVFYIAGLLLCSLGVSLLFHTYIAPEAYELFVKEIALRTGRDIHLVKTVYDCCSCLLAVVMSFLFMGFMHFEGVKWGTVLCALINGWVIGQCSRLLEEAFTFEDGLPLKTFFE